MPLARGTISPVSPIGGRGGSGAVPSLSLSFFEEIWLTVLFGQVYRLIFVGQVFKVPLALARGKLSIVYTETDLIGRGGVTLGKSISYCCKYVKEIWGKIE